MTEHVHEHDRFRCPSCQQALPLTHIDVVDVAAAVRADALTEDDVFKRTYLGHGSQSSVFVFQGHPGPFRRHIHTTHDEIGYVLTGSGSVDVGGLTRPVKPGDVWVIPAGTPHGGRFEDAPQVLFISSPIDDPDHQDRVWLDD
ncbi:MAG TPA: cupin domain-containing protein [Candidatus Eisenbacteria bacterium]|nr:cupin domain-containing protein [Candidatus Eisenbacteria bacterium]